MDFQNSGAAVVFLWCLKQVKDLILEFLINESFFSEKQLSDNYNIILVSFPLGGCVNEVVDNQANYQEYRYYVHFLRCHTFAVIHSVNGEGVY